VSDFWIRIPCRGEDDSIVDGVEPERPANG
jgi:hypothetical protein